MIQKERVKALNTKETRRGRYVLYWMQASQRTEDNHALEYAVLKANELNLPLVVFFGLTDRFPEANERHYTFMLEGLRDVKRSLEKRGIRMVIQHTSPEQGLVQFAKGASFVVVDRGYLRIQKEWRNRAAGLIDCPLVQVPQARIRRSHDPVEDSQETGSVPCSAERDSSPPRLPFPGFRFD
jgi:deoxyribodipyrimidine photo-lyase